MNRVFYMAGPGDVVTTYKYWRDGEDDPNQVAVTYSGQFFDVCRRRDLACYVVSHHHRVETVNDGQFRVEHRPIQGAGRGGLFYHLAWTWYTIRLVLSAILWRSDVIVTMQQSHLLPYAVARLFGVRIVISCHCALWPKCEERKLSARVLSHIDGWVYKNVASSILVISDDLVEQVREMTGSPTIQPIQFLPTYRQATFAEAAPNQDQAGEPFRVLFAGRIERNKGVFDLLQAASLLDKTERDYQFDICGTGTAFEDLTDAVFDAKLAESFHLHGHLTRGDMGKKFKACHVIVVPTRTDFVEGCNKVVVEAIMSRRPVITNAVCLAVEGLEEAAIEVPPNDADAIAAALEKLSGDPALYQTKVEACELLRRRFLDTSQGWAAAFEKSLDKLKLGRQEIPEYLSKPMETNVGA